MIVTKFISEEITYTGEELRPLYAYSEHKIRGDSLIAFVGPCKVGPVGMVDVEDIVQKDWITSDKMLHFILEIFQTPVDLEKSRMWQLLLCRNVCDTLNDQYGGMKRDDIFLVGDDLFVEDGKLSVSIATVSQVSLLVHFAMNVTDSGTPKDRLKIGSLENVSPNIDLEQLSQLIFAQFKLTYEDVRGALDKVRSV